MTLPNTLLVRTWPTKSLHDRLEGGEPRHKKYVILGSPPENPSYVLKVTMW